MRSLMAAAGYDHERSLFRAHHADPSDTLHNIYYAQLCIGAGSEGIGPASVPRMETERMGFWDWCVAGFAFAIGMSVAGALMGLVWLIVLAAGINAAFTSSASGTGSTPSFSTPAAFQSLAPRPTRSPVTRTVRTPMPPQSREECLELTGGVANKFYWACRNGKLYEKKTVTE